MEDIKETAEEKVMHSQMGKMMDTYDSYMKKMSMGREDVLRRITR
ncbi:MAG: hypothetical protein NTV01_20000 [Bacteroidia bacterium]|nr:hypothetical protein [Bacteroidia bacterium]